MSPLAYISCPTDALGWRKEGFLNKQISNAFAFNIGYYGLSFSVSSALDLGKWGYFWGWRELFYVIHIVKGVFPPLWLHPESGKYTACWGGRWSKRMGIVQQMVPRSRLDAELHWSGAKSKAGAPVLGGKAHVHATSKIQLIYFQSWIGYL